MQVDTILFKNIMRQFATGVMVLTVPDGTGMHAVTVNGLTSLSLNPLLMLVCIEKNAQSHRLVHASGIFALNILAESQKTLGELFAYDREARREPEGHAHGHPGTTGALLIDDCLGYLECRVTAEYPGGDHTIFVAEVVAGSLGNTTPGPLLYYNGQWRALTP